MDTFVAVSVVLLAAAWAASSLWRRFAGRSASSCSSGCSGCALASRGCGVAAATTPGAPPPPSGTRLPARDGEGR